MNIIDRLRRLARNRLLDAGAILAIVLVIRWWFAVIPPRWSQFDFNQYYVGARMLLEGQNPYTTSLKPMCDKFGFDFAPELPIAGYPPSFLWMFAPLAALSPHTAFVVWVGLELVCLAIILWVTRRLLRKELSVRGWLFVVSLTVISRTVSYQLYASQAQLLLAAMVISAYAAQRNTRYTWACLLVSAAGILKFYPFVLLPWFLWSGGGSVRTRILRALGMIGFLGLVLLLTGLGLWRDFIRYSLPMGVGEEVGRTFHFSLPALITNFGYWWHDFRPSPEAKRWWWTFGIVAGWLVILGSYGRCRRNPNDLETQFCLLCVAMLIGTVTVQGHYFVFVVFPLTVAAVRMTRKPTLGGIASIAFILIAINAVDPPTAPFFLRHLLLYLLVSNLPLYGLMGLAIYFWREFSVHASLENIPAPNVSITSVAN